MILAVARDDKEREEHGKYGFALCLNIFSKHYNDMDQDTKNEIEKHNKRVFQKATGGFWKKRSLDGLYEQGRD